MKTSFLKKSVVIFCIYLVIIVAYGCNKKVTETVVRSICLPKIKVKENKYAVWKQSIDKKIEAGDPVVFYNEYEITVVGTIPIKVKEYLDGQVVFTDSSVVFDYSIPAETPGNLVEVGKGDSRGPVSFTVKFTQKDTKNYNHIFKIQPDSTYALDTKMKIDFNGIDYEHEASISDEWGGLCKILYKPKELDKRKHVIEPAEGVSVKGTKKIK